jgi:alkylation response protein AidB-like acyl-CoA dehydrogenase
MNFDESAEHEMLRKAVSTLASKYGHNYILNKARTDQRATELWDELGRNGYLGVNVAEEYGGGGMGITELAIVLEELCAEGCPLMLLVVSPAICATLIGLFGSQDQKEQWLPGFATGEIKMAFAITEPDAGSNSHRITTTATRDGDEYRISGTKYYISGVDEADALLLIARTSVSPNTGRARLSMFIVPTDSAGLRWDQISVEITAAERQYTVFFDDVVIPAGNLIGDQNRGLHQMFAGLNPERIMIAAMSNGIARYAINKATSYANSREVWGVPIGAHQGLAHPLAKAKIECDLARLMTQKAAWLYDNGREAGEAANMAKFAAADASLACLDQAVQIHGGNGFATEYGLADLWGLARLLRTAPVSREMVLNYVAEHSLGLPKSY